MARSRSLAQFARLLVGVAVGFCRRCEMKVQTVLRYHS